MLNGWFALVKSVRRVHCLKDNIVIIQMLHNINLAAKRVTNSDVGHQPYCWPETLTAVVASTYLKTTIFYRAFSLAANASSEEWAVVFVFVAFGGVDTPKLQNSILNSAE